MPESEEKKPENCPTPESNSVLPVETSQERSAALRTEIAALLSDSQQQMLGSCLLNSMKLYSLSRELILGDPRFSREAKLELIKQLREAVGDKSADQSFSAAQLIKDVRTNLLVLEKVVKLIDHQRQLGAQAFRKAFHARKDDLSGFDSVFARLYDPAVETPFGKIIDVCLPDTDPRTVKLFAEAVSARLGSEGWGVVRAIAAKPDSKLALSDIRGLFNAHAVDFLVLAGGFKITDYDGLYKVLVANRAVCVIISEVNGPDAISASYLDGMVFLAGQRISEIPLAAAPKIVQEKPIEQVKE